MQAAPNLKNNTQNEPKTPAKESHFNTHFAQDARKTSASKSMEEKLADIEEYITSLMPSSLKNLKPGMVIEEDVYCSESTRLLVRGGTLMCKATLEKLKKINKDSDKIFITNKSYISFIKESVRLAKKTGEAVPTSFVGIIQEGANARRLEREKETGFDVATQSTVELLNEIVEDKHLDEESISRFSVEISSKLDSSDASTVFELINSLAPVDEYLQRHCMNTGLLNGLFGRWLGMNKEEIDRLVLIGALHDCGKALMPRGILNASRQLTHTEFEVMKFHPVRGYETLSTMPSDVRKACRGHHEKFDGTGYPDRLKGNEILLESRITAISDVYDAIVSRRSYKNPASPFNVLAILQSMSKTHFDPELIELFMQNMPNELLGKQVLLSDGSVGVVHAINSKNIEFPEVIVSGMFVKTNKLLHCVQML